MTWFSREQARRFLFSRIGSVLIFALLIGVGVVFLLQMLRNAARESGYDFTAYLHAATVFLQGGNPYQLGAKFPFIYPLFTCILIVPFQAVPYWLANLCWFGINVTSLGLSAFFLLKIIARALSVRQCLGLALVPILLTINLTQSNLVNGQINFFVMLLCVLFLHALLSERKVLAAALLAAAIAIKLTPLVFLVFLVLRKEFRVLAWTVGFTCLFTLLLPFLFVGSRVFALYDGYLHSFLVARLSDGSTPAELGFNLGAFLRLVFPDLNGAVMFVLTAARRIVVGWGEWSVKDWPMCRWRSLTIACETTAQPPARSRASAAATLPSISCVGGTSGEESAGGAITQMRRVPSSSSPPR